jgi:N-acetylmuramoyl-L-alanine amidase/Mannosyl-glycoprotein endo-beta-N-acetylglucosaminidase
MFSWDNFVKVLANSAIEFERLKVIQLAQAILESGRGQSDLFKLHGNPYGMKYRREMSQIADPVSYTGSDGVTDDYCKFDDLEDAVKGYWIFIERPPYRGWRQNNATPEAYIRFITYAGYFGGPFDGTEVDRQRKEGYISKVLGLVPEARQLLEQQRQPRLRFTSIPNEIRAEEPFTIAGEADDFEDGEELVLIVDDEFEIARPRVKDEKWQANLFLHQSGKRKLEIIASEQERAEIELDVKPSEELEILPRGSWGARAAKPLPDLINPKRITVHHTFAPAEPAIGQAAESRRMRQIQNAHMDGRGWSDIGYHYMIMASGRIYQGRPERKRGSHDVINDGLGICFDGDYTNRQITDAQFRSAVALCTKLCQRMGITDPVTPVSTRTNFGTRQLPRILGHRDRVATNCPGVEGGRTVRLNDIRLAVREALNK